MLNSLIPVCDQRQLVENSRFRLYSGKLVRICLAREKKGKRVRKKYEQKNRA